MPVKIIRKTEGKSSTPAVKVLSSLVDGRPDIKKTIKVGDEEIYPDLDVMDTLGKSKFLVHFRKPGLWYRIVSFDEQGEVFKLQSIHGTVFESKLTAMVPRNYMVVTAPSGQGLPSDAVLAKVHGLLPSEAH